MLADKDKISLRQALLVYLILLFSSAVRFIPAYSANIAKQAAYLAPVVSFFAIYPIIFLIYKVFDKYKETSMINIVYLVIGKTAGKILLALYAFWILLLTALFARYYAERLVTSTFVTTKINVFIIVILVIVAISLKKGFVTIARMNEIIFPLVSIAFFGSCKAYICV
ncbi:MAG: GerAB/ArcD/ProY family transporter [Lutispora sp.]|nr:GerAB/ArcD/ProY family transporter [Lutispora sp.]